MTYFYVLPPPPIPWRYWVVYYRFPDDRIMYFRGSRRNNLYIRNMLCGTDGDWSWEPDYARLFQFEPIITLSSTAKSLGEQVRQDILQHTNYQGFHGTVLRTHLILPRG